MWNLPRYRSEKLWASVNNWVENERCGWNESWSCIEWSEVHVWGKGNLSQNLGTSSSNQSAPFLVFLPPSLIFSCYQLGVLHWSCALFIITTAKVKSHRQGSKQTRRQRKPESTCSYMNKLKTSCLGYYYPRDGFPMIQQTTFDSTLFTWADLKIDMAKSGNTSEMDIAGTWGGTTGYDLTHSVLPGEPGGTVTSHKFSSKGEIWGDALADLSILRIFSPRRSSVADRTVYCQQFCWEGCNWWTVPAAAFMSPPQHS